MVVPIAAVSEQPPALRNQAAVRATCFNDRNAGRTDWRPQGRMGSWAGVGIHGESTGPNARPSPPDCRYLSGFADAPILYGSGDRPDCGTETPEQNLQSRMSGKCRSRSSPFLDDWTPYPQTPFGSIIQGWAIRLLGRTAGPGTGLYPLGYR